LGWGAPCQFSGATSLGRDVGSALNPSATEVDLIRYTRWSLVLLTGLMILFGLLRTEQSAWWNILAWTLRNGATLAPVLAVLFWPAATRLSAQAALVVGFLAGLSWYHLGDWDPTMFHYGIHPVWVGMSLNITTLVLVTMTTSTWRLATRPVHRRRGALALLAALVLTAVTAASWDQLHPLGLTGLAIFTSAVLTAISAFQLVRQPSSIHPPGSGTVDQREEGVQGAEPSTTRATI
ncbi:MAG: sodium:solute symporter family protein, partial [Ornithinimicrobium sp.]